MARDEGNTGGDNVREMESGWTYISGSQFSEPANLHGCLANLLLLSSEKFLIGAGQFWGQNWIELEKKQPGVPEPEVGWGWSSLSPFDFVSKQSS